MLSDPAGPTFALRSNTEYYRSTRMGPNAVPSPNPDQNRRTGEPVPATPPQGADPLKGMSVHADLRERLATETANAPAANRDTRPVLPDRDTRSVSPKPTTPIERKPNGVAILRIGGPDERVVTFNAERCAALAEAVESLHKNPPTALVVTGPSLGMFAVGADINAIKDVTDPAVGAQLAREGQKLFSRLAALPCKKVAAISGPCVGGAYELSLACDERVSDDSPKTTIGLPETQLGILPGWGGTQRLPRLVGVGKALDLILKGERHAPREALKNRMIDKVVPSDRLLGAAEERALATDKPPRHLPFIERLASIPGFVGSLVRELPWFGARAQAEKPIAKFRKDYPATQASIDSVLYGLRHGLERGLEFEARKLGELIATPTSKSLTHLFFCQEAVKDSGKGAEQKVENIDCMVIGAGVMGPGIAVTFAKKNANVLLKDIKPEALEAGMARAASSFEKTRSMTQRERAEALARITPITGDHPAVRNVKVVIEAVLPNLGLKQNILAGTEPQLGPDTIWGSNASVERITDIQSAAKDPSRVVGIHFFNPPERMRLVEIVRGAQTSEETIRTVAAMVTKLGKFPIVVNDVPGYLVNRVLTPFADEISHLLKDGYAIADIEKAAKRFGFPMGPFRLIDEIGLDIGVEVSRTMRAGYGDRMGTSDFLEKLVSAGLLGKKSGAGFYTYDAKGSEAKETGLNPKVAEILGLPAPTVKQADLDRIGQRLVGRMLNEGVLCLDEGVAGEPGRKAAMQIDLGSVYGISFPGHRGGLIRYAETLGAKEILAQLRTLEHYEGPRFAPAPGIVERAETGRSFYAKKK